MVTEILLIIAAIILFLTGFFLGNKGKDQLKRELEHTKSRLSSADALNKELKKHLYSKKE